MSILYEDIDNNSTLHSGLVELIQFTEELFGKLLVNGHVHIKYDRVKKLLDDDQMREALSDHIKIIHSVANTLSTLSNSETVTPANIKQVFPPLKKIAMLLLLLYKISRTPNDNEVVVQWTNSYSNMVASRNELKSIADFAKSAIDFLTSYTLGGDHQPNEQISTMDDWVFGGNDSTIHVYGVINGKGIKSSAITKFDIARKLVSTQNTIYRLGVPKIRFS